jgi:hypothetical protein
MRNEYNMVCGCCRKEPAQGSAALPVALLHKHKEVSLSVSENLMKLRKSDVIDPSVKIGENRVNSVEMH